MTAHMATDNPDDLVNLVRYRLGDPVTLAAIVAEGRRQLAADGCAILPDFVGPGVAQRMADEILGLMPWAHRRDLMLRAYANVDETGLSAGDPRRRANPYCMHAVATDQFDPAGPVLRLYMWDGLTRLVAEILDEPRLYRVADPMMSCNATILGEGDQHGWHFDSNDFVVSLLLQAPAGGGRFVFAPGIRSEADQNYDCVAAAMDGEGRLLRQPPMAPGALILFRGRNSLHRVTPVEGPVKRIVALFSYDRRPDMQFSEQSRINVFGRSQPIAGQPAIGQPPRPAAPAMSSSM